MKLKLVYTVAVLICSNISFSQSKNKSVFDSIEVYRQQSKLSTSYTLKERLAFAKRAQKLAYNFGIDSIVIKCNRRISTLYWETKDYDAYKEVNHENIRLSQKNRDSISLAKANFNLGYLYNKKIKRDSSFYFYSKARKIYNEIDDSLNEARVLLNMAIIQKNEKDFTGSEINSTRGIELIEFIENEEALKLKSNLYNNLGIVFGELKEFEKSVEYHYKAIKLRKKFKSNPKNLINISKNNLAITYKKSGQYDLALKYFKEILSNDNLLKFHPDFHALILNNYAHTLYLSNNKEQLPELYLKALKISDSSYSMYNSIIIHQHLAEFYNNENLKSIAKYHANIAKTISERYHKDDLLKSLYLLSKIEEDSIAVKHYDAYITLNDSLVKAERAIRNKFIRIEYETDKVEEKNRVLFNQNIWLIVLSAILMFSAFLIYLNILQRTKNKTLYFKQQQQHANEEIYNLMLTQQDKIEEAKALEKKRISEDLHDGVLGRLFGTRLSLDSLNQSNTDEAIKNRSIYIEQLKDIEEDIREVSHELNANFNSNSGYIEMIKTLVANQTKAYNLDYKLTKNNIIWEKISNKTKIHFYRILQETLQNIYKHANASLVTINFQLQDNNVCLTIKDNGSGFNLNTRKKGIGIKNMKSRIHDINGEINITSKKNSGTIIDIKVPT